MQLYHTKTDKCSFVDGNEKWEDECNDFMRKKSRKKTISIIAMKSVSLKKCNMKPLYSILKEMLKGSRCHIFSLVYNIYIIAVVVVAGDDIEYECNCIESILAMTRIYFVAYYFSVSILLEC